MTTEKDPAEIIDTIAQSIRVSQRGMRKVRAHRHGPKRQGIIAGRARELLAALDGPQRVSRAAREFRSLAEDTTGMREIPA